MRIIVDPHYYEFMLQQSFLYKLLLEVLLKIIHKIVYDILHLLMNMMFTLNNSIHIPTFLII